MKTTTQSCIVLVTAPNRETARDLARAALKEHLVACANLVPEIESHYWWEGNIEFDTEVLVILKTTKARLAALEKVVVANHPYETPEFLAVPLSGGHGRYLDWLVASVKKPDKNR